MTHPFGEPPRPKGPNSLLALEPDLQLRRDNARPFTPAVRGGVDYLHRRPMLKTASGLAAKRSSSLRQQCYAAFRAPKNRLKNQKFVGMMRGVFFVFQLIGLQVIVF
jgi:hypothetical protein